MAGPTWRDQRGRSRARQSVLPGDRDREAAKPALAEFIDHTHFTSQQLEFVNQIVDQLTEHEVMDKALSV